MDEEWDIHSSQRPSVRQVIDLAKREYEAAMQALEPDPNADPLTQLDQQWAKESMKYTGSQRSKFGIPVKQEPQPFIMLGFTLVFVAITIILVVAKAYCMSFFLLPIIIVMAFVMRNQFKFAKAQKDYLVKRAQLIAQLGLRPEQVPLAPVVEKPLVHRTSLFSAESQIRQLQNYYRGVHDQEQYRRSVKSIIGSAPEHERDYLRAFAAIESEWVEARLKYINFKNGRRTQIIPRPANVIVIIPICVLFAGVFILQYLSNGNLVSLVGGIMIPSVIAIVANQSNKNAKKYRELEQYYAEKRKQLHSRFRERAPF